MTISQDRPTGRSFAQLLTMLDTHSPEEVLHCPKMRQVLREMSRPNSGPPTLEPRALDLFLELVDQAMADPSVPAAGIAEADRSRVILVPDLMSSRLLDLRTIKESKITVSDPIERDGCRRRVDPNQAWLWNPLHLSDDPAGIDAQPLGEGTSAVGSGLVPLLYASLELAVRYRAPGVAWQVFSYDWRADLDEAASQLVQVLVDRTTQSEPRVIVAHGTGALVARRALQRLGPGEALSRVQTLILVGPANHGSLAALWALAGQPGRMDLFRRLHNAPGPAYIEAFRSWLGIYQGLPISLLKRPHSPAHRAWQQLASQLNVDLIGRSSRWASAIDTRFFDPRTLVILGDVRAPALMAPGDPSTADPLSTLLHDLADLPGDGEVPHSCAVLRGATTYLARTDGHAGLMNAPDTIAAVLAVLSGRALPLPTVSSEPQDYLSQPELGRPMICTSGQFLSLPSASLLPRAVPPRPVDRVLNGTFLGPDPHALTCVNQTQSHAPVALLGPTGQQRSATESLGTTQMFHPEEPALSLDPALRKFSPQAIAGTSNLLPFEFLRTGDRLGRAVVKIQRGDGSVGTGFLIAPQILLTNHHVLPDSETAATAYALANYEAQAARDVAGQPAIVPLRPEELFVCHHELDFAFCGVAGLEHLGVIPVQRHSLNVLRLECVNIIQHPRGRPKEIALQDNRVVQVDDLVVQYSCDTEPGSSGSPVFNNQWRLVAMHHASVMAEDPEGKLWTGDEGRARYLNEGIRLSAIALWLETHEMNQGRSPRHRESVVRVRRSIEGLDARAGFFGALGLRTNDRPVSEVIRACYADQVDDLDIGYWDLGDHHEIAHASLPEMASEASDLGMDLWILAHLDQADADRFCQSLRHHQGPKYEWSWIAPIDPWPSLTIAWRPRPGFHIQVIPTESRAQWDGDAQQTHRLEIALTRDGSSTICELELLIVPASEFFAAINLKRWLDRDFTEAPEPISTASARRTNRLIVGQADSIRDLVAQPDPELPSTSARSLRVATDDRVGLALITPCWGSIDQCFVQDPLQVIAGSHDGLAVIRDRDVPETLREWSEHPPMLMRLTFRAENPKTLPAPDNLLSREHRADPGHRPQPAVTRGSKKEDPTAVSRIQPRS